MASLKSEELLNVLYLYLLLSAGLMGSLSALGVDGTYRRCEPITIKMCKDMRYNMTQMPNLAGQENQIEAEARIQDFLPLVQTNCSRLLKFFLCSVYAPMCTELVRETITIPACKSMCLQVKSKCEPLLLTFNFEWPEMLACDKLPDKSDPKNNLCMSAPNVTEEPDIDVTALLRPRFEDIEANLNKLDTSLDWKAIIMEKLRKNPRLILPPTTDKSIDQSKFHQNTCPSKFVFIDHALRSNNTCAPRCDVDVSFRQEDKDFAEVWMIVWSSLCLVSTLITVATFIIDTARFKYPERPFIFISFCYLIQSFAYIIRAVIGSSSLSCDIARDGLPFVIQEGLEIPWCIVVFLLLYFFGMASCVWWVILTLSLYLAAGRKWSQESIESLSSYFHLAGWAIPALKTIIIMIMRRVDGDELTGLCYVGFQDRDALAIFVLIPLIIYIILSFVFLVGGFLAMVPVRNDIKQNRSNRQDRKLEKVMTKLGVFAVLYTVPAISVIGCHFYERMNLDRWRSQAMSFQCSSSSIEVKPAEPEDSIDCPLEHSIPLVEVYMLKIFMSLVVGTTSGMWIWSRKTLASWRNFLERKFARRKNKSFNTSYHLARSEALKSGFQNGSRVGRRLSNERCSPKPVSSRI